MAEERPLRKEDIAKRYYNGIPVNPLAHKSELDLMQDVEKFYDQHQFPEYIDSSDLTLDDLKRGALLAANEKYLQESSSNRDETEETVSVGTHEVGPDTAAFREIAKAGAAAMSSGYQTEEHENSISDRLAPGARNQSLLPRELKVRTRLETVALKKEKNPRLQDLTRDTIFILATCAIGALAQGCAQESIVGANLQWPVDLGIARELPTTPGHEDYQMEFERNGQTKFSLVNAIPYLAASVCGAWLSDPLTFVYGRRFAIFVAGVFSLAGTIGAAYSQTWEQLLVCRLLQGIGIGAKSSVIPILESEIAPPKMRGRVLVFWQTFVATGIALAAATNCIFHGHWRLQLGINFVSAIPLLFCCFFMPESHYWLIKKGRYPEAFLVLRRLRPTKLQATRDLYLIYAHGELESWLPRKSGGRKITYLNRLPKLFSEPRNFRAVLGASAVMIAQQFCGTNIFAFLATSVFDAGEFSPMTSLWFTLGISCCNAVFSASAYFLVDRFGRRSLLISSLILMFPFLCITAKEMEDSSRNSQAAVASLVIIYMALYSFGAGAIPFMYSSEVFSVMYREVGMSFACMINFAFAGVLAILVSRFVYSDPLRSQDMQSSASISNESKILYIFAGLDIVAAINVWFFMRTPEEPKSLEDMDFIFGGSSADFVHYQWSVALPWVLKWPYNVLSRSQDSKSSYPCSYSTWQETRQETKGRSTVDAEMSKSQ